MKKKSKKIAYLKDQTQFFSKNRIKGLVNKGTRYIFFNKILRISFNDELNFPSININNDQKYISNDKKFFIFK